MTGRAENAPQPQWFGEVPSNWSVDRLKRSVASARNGLWGLDPDGGAEDVRCIRVADFDRKRQRVHDDSPTLRRVSARDREGRTLRAGDLILEKSGGGEKSPVGFVVLYDREELAVCSNFTAKVRLVEGMDPRYWVYVHGAMYERRLTMPHVRQTSGIQNLDQDSYFDVLVCYPPSGEQVLIADFLDDETAKIDALIAKQEQLIATLQEDRIATITHAVTRGLGGSSLQDSGEDWLGKLPEHWKVVPFVKCTTDRVDYRGATPKKTDSGVQLITARNVKRGWIDYESSQEYVDATEYEQIMRRGIPRLGDLLLTMEAPLGNVALVDRTDIALAQRIIKFRMNPEIVTPDFARYSLLSTWFQAQLASRGTGSTALGLKASKLPELKLAIPPIGEQQEIAVLLSDREASIEGLQRTCEATIATLREYRSALITDAVTGKIDGREMV